MSLATNVTDLATRIASEVKSLRTQINGNTADLSGLNTTAKGNLVAAINEVAASLGNAGAQISDSTVSTLTVWSSNKTDTQIKAAVAALIASSPGTLDTLDELAAALGDDPNFAATVTTALGNRVRFDAAQTLTGAQQVQARANIAAGTSNLVIGTSAGTAADGAALVSGLAGKAATTHGHVLTDANITGVLPLAQMPTHGHALTDANMTGVLPVAQMPSHTHTIAQVSDATTIGKAVMGAADAAAARSAIGAGTGTSNLVIGTTSGTAADAAALATSLAGKSATSHTHANATDAVPGFVMLATAAEAATGTDTTHAVTPAGLKAVADTKAAASHTHTTAQVTGLDTALAGKSATSHTHTMASLTDTTAFGTSLGTTASAATARTLLAVFSTTDIGDVNANFVATFEAGLV